MSDDLVERLYEQADRRHGSIGSLRSLEWKAADRIEAQEAEIRSLREQVAKERMGIVQWLRVHGKWPRGTSHAGILADAIERGEDKTT